LLSVTVPPEPAAVLVPPPAALELELELEPPQAARYSAIPALVVVVMKPRRVVRFCSPGI
jgi:hypothetical protein